MVREGQQGAQAEDLREEDCDVPNQPALHLTGELTTAGLQSLRALQRPMKDYGKRATYKEWKSLWPDDRGARL